MGREKSESGESKPADKPKAPEEITLQPSGEVVVTHTGTAARAPEGKQIHPRRPLPRIPEAPAKRGPGSPEADRADPQDEGTGRPDP
jgi:hypothetical protein